MPYNRIATCHAIWSYGQTLALNLDTRISYTELTNPNPNPNLNMTLALTLTLTEP